jgi:hypothetical protein
MKKNIGLFAGLASVLVFLMIFSSSCSKEEDTIAVITVVDSSGSPVTSATVTLHQDQVINPVTGNQASVRVTQTTGSSGTAEFIFDLEAYLDIDASKGTKTGHAFVRLKQNETVAQTVVIR